MSPTPKRALIAGITGQDGSYLAERLLAKGYEVHGIIRRSSTFNTQRIEHLYEDVHSADRPLRLHHGDMADGNGLARLIGEIEPHEVYNLAVQSRVRVSFDQPNYTADVTAVGILRLLEAIRDYQDHSGQTDRFYQASSLEMFGKVRETPQTETTPFHPRSPYRVAKVYANWATVNYRESYGLHASCGILFNHESPRRGETFVTRKITRAAARIKLGLQEKLYLGNLEAQRDWGFAGDYVEAMWLMLQRDEPDDHGIPRLPDCGAGGIMSPWRTERCQEETRVSLPKRRCIQPSSSRSQCCLSPRRIIRSQQPRAVGVGVPSLRQWVGKHGGTSGETDPASTLEELREDSKRLKRALKRAEM